MTRTRKSANRQDLERHIAKLTASNKAMRHLLDEFEKNQANLQRFRVALDYSADAISLADRASMRFIDVNQTACERLGYSREELLKMGPQNILQGKTVGEEIDLLVMIGAINSAVNELIPSGFATRISSALDVPLALALNELLVNARKFSSGAVDIEISGSRENATLRIVNPTRVLPQQIRASGLELIKALLNTEGAAFTFEHGDDHFSAEICLTPPVLMSC